MFKYSSSSFLFVFKLYKGNIKVVLKFILKAKKRLKHAILLFVAYALLFFSSFLKFSNFSLESPADAVA